MRKLATVCLAFSAAVAAAQYCFANSTLPMAAAVCFLLSLSALLISGVWRKRIILLCYGMALGFLFYWGFYQLRVAPAEALVGQQGVVELRVLDYAEETDYGAKLSVELPGGIRARYYGDREPLFSWQPGDLVLAEAEVCSAFQIRETTTNTFYCRGYYLRLYQRGHTAGLVAEHSDALRYLPQRLCHWAQERIALLYEEDTAPFMRAILTGDREELTEKQYADLVGAGLLHITAVSGLHCAFLLGMVELLTGRRRDWLKAILGLPLVLLFTLAVGSKPSMVRSCVMMCFLLLAPLFGRESDRPTALCAALTVILLHNPYAIASVGLQLSFAAMAGLLWLSPRVYRALTRHQKEKGGFGRSLWRLAASNLAATVGATVFTTPISALYFGTVSLASLLGNLLVILPAGWIFGLGLLSLPLSALSLPLGRIVGALPQLLIRYVLRVADGLTRLPYHALYLTNPYIGYWLVYVYVLAIACAAVLRQRRSRITAAALSLCSLVLCLVLVGSEQQVGNLQVRVLDVGQGESVLLCSHGETALVDCGSKSGLENPGSVAAETLLGLGYQRLDRLVLTHDHVDHANGLPRLLAMISVGELIVPDTTQMDLAALKALAAQYGIPLRVLSEKECVALGSATLTLYPPAEEGRDDNEACMAVLVSQQDFDLLVTGDMPSAQEKALLSRVTLPQVEVLVPGHHGSKYSSSREFLQALQPEAAVISVGDNTYGHPTEEAMQRMARAGAVIYRTDRQGTVTIIVS